MGVGAGRGTDDRGLPTSRRIQKARQPESEEAAYVRALRLLGIRARGRAELERDLERRGFAPAAAGPAVARLAAEGWLDDLEAARAMVRAKEARYGRLRIARELAARGFSDETARSALAELESGREREALARAYRRLWKGAAGQPLPRRRARVRRALLARGFAAEAISAMIRGSDEIDGSSGEIP